MTLISKLLWLILAYPLAEILIFRLCVSYVGSRIAWLWIMGSILLGLILLRRGKRGIALAFAALFRQPTLSFYQALWPIRYKIAGVLLIIPGILSDLIALALLLPLKGQKVHYHSHVTQNTASSHTSRYGESETIIIEGEYRDLDTPATHDPHRNRS